MTNYHPLLTKAVAGLEVCTGPGRRALYERARNALVAQLRKVDPPLSESEITRERLSLEEAIRQVESDAVRSLRSIELEQRQREEERHKQEEEQRKRLDEERKEEKRRKQEEEEQRNREAEEEQKQEELRRIEERRLREETDTREQKRAEKKAATLVYLARTASPQPSITPDGRLDAGPNPTYDAPLGGDELSSLPIRQRSLIKIVVGDLPSNAPKHLKGCLRAYDDELKARGTQPILGLLKDMADIIQAAARAPSAEDEWLEPGVRQALDRFAENHKSFVDHFPLDPERENLYAQTPVDEDAATGKALTEPFEKVSRASTDAHKAGLATEDFLAVMEKMTEFARVLSTEPPAPASNPTRGSQSDGSPSDEIRVTQHDRIAPVSAKKRTILRALGFFERAYNLAGSSATLAGPPQGNSILEALRAAIEMLSRLIH